LGKSRDSSVGVGTGYELDDWAIGFRFPARAGNFSLPHHVQTGSAAHPGSCAMGTGDCFPGGKVVVTWSWLLSSI
jgi:hypothetical protein